MWVCEKVCNYEHTSMEGFPWMKYDEIDEILHGHAGPSVLEGQNTWSPSPLWRDPPLPATSAWSPEHVSVLKGGSHPAFFLGDLEGNLKKQWSKQWSKQWWNSRGITPGSLLGRSFIIHLRKKSGYNGLNRENLSTQEEKEK